MSITATPTEVEHLLDRIRRLVQESTDLERRGARFAEIETVREETERLHGRLASVVKHGLADFDGNKHAGPDSPQRPGHRFSRCRAQREAPS